MFQQNIGGVTAGQLLCGALFSPDSLTSWLASCALSDAILRSKPQQEALVRVQLGEMKNSYKVENFYQRKLFYLFKPRPRINLQSRYQLN